MSFPVWIIALVFALNGQPFWALLFVIIACEVDK